MSTAGRWIFVSLALVAGYFAVGAVVIAIVAHHFVLHPPAPFEEPTGAQTISVSTPLGQVSLRSYGSPINGCVLVFPGQHGRVADYERAVVPALNDRGIAVFLLSYAYSDGSLPATRHIEGIAKVVVSEVERRCGAKRYVLAGRSLGAMVALYSWRAGNPAGLVLEGLSPSLSLAIRRELEALWFTAPLALLPIGHLVAHDHSLAEAASFAPLPRTVIFQGANDTRTPLKDLAEHGRLPNSVVVVPVEGADHSNAYRVAFDRYIETIAAMLMAR
jgi:alpha-beta hydrolase superfamily lysophospholipase